MSEHVLPMWMAWHGRMMVAAWVVLLPLGILLARFFKITPRQAWPQQLDNRFWWHGHLGLQYLGITIMTCAALLARLHGDAWQQASPMHRIGGWIVVALAWIQVVGGWLRGSKGGPQPHAFADIKTAVPGDHYDMTLRRRVFERVHKSCGYAAMALSVPTIILGLRLADAPVWMLWTIASAWTLGVILFVVLQWHGRCVDTYQAIWGADPGHPGNRRAPIGWGVHRLAANPDTESESRHD